MATKLTIDEGNSSTKIAVWHDDTLVDEMSGDRSNAAAFDAFLQQHSPVDTAIFCSVCRRDANTVRSRLAPLARKVIVLDASTPMPISLGYRTPHTLGPDRIAAAAGAAAIAPRKTILVVDMGTAITYDVVTPAGEFIGGNIAPGIFVRLEALNHYTSALPLIETDGDCPRWGYDTETALRAGAIRGVVGELQYYRHCLLAMGPDPTVILTGGSADLILPFITSETIYEPNLVLIGLNSIINYNEK